MFQWILLILTIYLAAVGLVQVCLSVSRGLTGSDKLNKGVLLLPVQGDDPAMEMKIRRAHGELCGNARLGGVKLAVVNCGGNAETMSVCYRLCADKNLPLVEVEEVPRLFREEL